MFDAVEEPLDAVARAIEHRAETGLPAPVDHRRNVWGGAGSFDLPTQPIGTLSSKRTVSGRRCPSRPAATGQSPAWPGVSTSSTGRPLASVRAWIFVVSPPRERPIQRSGWRF